MLCLFHCFIQESTDSFVNLALAEVATPGILSFIPLERYTAFIMSSYFIHYFDGRFNEWEQLMLHIIAQTSMPLDWEAITSPEPWQPSWVRMLDYQRAMNLPWLRLLFVVVAGCLRGRALRKERLSKSTSRSAGRRNRG